MAAAVRVSFVPVRGAHVFWGEGGGRVGVARAVRAGGRAWTTDGWTTARMVYIRERQSGADWRRRCVGGGIGGVGGGGGGGVNGPCRRQSGGIILYTVLTSPT